MKKRKYHTFIPELQYFPSKPLCKKCGFAKKNIRHRKLGIGLIMHILFGDGTSLKNQAHPQRICEGCFKKKKLTRHHLKDLKGNKTGKIQLLCRDCHDIAECQYIQKGIVKPTPKGTIIIKNSLKRIK